MKIQGPKGPTAPGVEGAEKTEGTTETGGKFVDKLGGPSGPAGPGAPGGPGGADPIAALARQVEAGAVTGKQALEKLMELASSQGALAALPEAVRERLRAQLAELVKEDAFLAEKAKRLGMPDGVDE